MVAKEQASIGAGAARARVKRMRVCDMLRACTSHEQPASHKLTPPASIVRAKLKVISTI